MELKAVAIVAVIAAALLAFMIQLAHWLDRCEDERRREKLALARAQTRAATEEDHNPGGPLTEKQAGKLLEDILQAGDPPEGRRHFHRSPVGPAPGAAAPGGKVPGIDRGGRRGVLPPPGRRGSRLRRSGMCLLARRERQLPASVSQGAFAHRRRAERRRGDRLGL